MDTETLNESGLYLAYKLEDEFFALDICKVFSCDDISTIVNADQESSAVPA